MQRDVAINGYDQPYVAVQAVYRGLPVARNLDALNNATIWKGILAIPIRLGGFNSEVNEKGTPLDQLTVGALTLDSTHFVVPTHRDGSAVPDHERGVIARLYASDTAELIELLYEAVPYVLFGA
jgi:hypothetical protein